MSANDLVVEVLGLSSLLITVAVWTVLAHGLGL